MFDKVILETIKDFEGSSEISPLRKHRWHAEQTETGADDANRWFSVTMSTGIVSILLHSLPYNAKWLYWISVVVFVVNVALFVIFTCISVIRYTMYPEIWGAMIRHPTQSLFLGTFPMGFATIVNMVVFVCVPSWGPWTTTLAGTMWWIDVVVSTAICFYMPFVMFANIFRSEALLPIYLLIIDFGI
jgi:tellurite resistance protein TehA-like permease